MKNIALITIVSAALVAAAPAPFKAGPVVTDATANLAIPNTNFGRREAAFVDEFSKRALKLRDSILSARDGQDDQADAAAAKGKGKADAAAAKAKAAKKKAKQQAAAQQAAADAAAQQAAANATAAAAAGLNATAVLANETAAANSTAAAGKGKGKGKGGKKGKGKAGKAKGNAAAQNGGANSLIDDLLGNILGGNNAAQQQGAAGGIDLSNVLASIKNKKRDRAVRRAVDVRDLEAIEAAAVAA